MIFEKLFGKKSKSPSTEKAETEEPNNDIVAIAMAMHLYFDEVHDDESNVITIKRIERRYSPWSSKIYGVNNNIR
jgi:hypothetical protein